MKCQLCSCHGEAVAQVIDPKGPTRYVCRSCADAILLVSKVFGGDLQVFDIPMVTRLVITDATMEGNRHD